MTRCSSSWVIHLGLKLAVPKLVMNTISTARQVRRLRNCPMSHGFYLMTCPRSVPEHLRGGLIPSSQSIIEPQYNCRVISSLAASLLSADREALHLLRVGDAPIGAALHHGARFALWRWHLCLDLKRSGSGCALASRAVAGREFAKFQAGHDGPSQPEGTAQPLDSKGLSGKPATLFWAASVRSAAAGFEPPAREAFRNCARPGLSCTAHAIGPGSFSAC